MIRRDYLQRQIDQLGKALGKLITLLMDGNGSGDTSEKTEQVNEIITEHLDMNLEELLKIPEDRFISELVNQKKLNIYNLEKMAEILEFLGREHFENHEKEKSKPYLIRSIIILEYLESQDSTFDMERSFKINALKEMNN